MNYLQALLQDWRPLRSHLMTLIWTVKYNKFRSKRTTRSPAYQGPLLLVEISKTGIYIRAWVANYNHLKRWDVISHPGPNFNGDLVKPPLNLSYEERWDIKKWLS